MGKFRSIALFVSGSLVTLLVITLWPKNPAPVTTTNPPTPTIAATITPSPTPTDLIQITNVIDGDTVRLANGKVVRLIGIDTPEISSKNDCFGQQASQKANELLQDQHVRLEKDISETDRYNRLLRYVWKGEELVNEILVAQGYARVSTYPPDVKYQDRFLAAERAAREANLGLWSACLGTPTLPAGRQEPTTKAALTPTTPPTSSTYTCNCSKTCPNMSCAEAQYQLDVCGCSARDADDDGTACDSQCQ